MSFLSNKGFVTKGVLIVAGMMVDFSILIGKQKKVIFRLKIVSSSNLCKEHKMRFAGKKWKRIGGEYTLVVNLRIGHFVIDTNIGNTLLIL